MASCTMQPDPSGYQAVRPLGVVSAVLLVAAAAVAVAREETRRTAHGRALVAHALCLAAANTIQVTWFFNTITITAKCNSYTYPAYFFMIAANLWLTAITINMMKNFRRPLGAMARGAGKGTTSSAVWRRFGIMSAFSWGISSAMAILAIAMHEYRFSIHKNGFIPPNFFETRMCGIEASRTLRLGAKDGSELLVFHRLGALFYYYIPVAILVALNGVCMALTGHRVRQLSKESAFAQGSASSKKSDQTSYKNVSLYVKLMLTSGILELLVETVAWSLGQYVTIDETTSFSSSFENIYMFGIIATFLDLIRAVSVFWLCMGPWCNLSAGCNLCYKAMISTWGNLTNNLRSLREYTRKFSGATNSETNDTIVSYRPSKDSTVN